MSIQFCVGIALSAFVTFLPSFAHQQGMPLTQAGSLIAVFGGMGIVSRIVLTPLGAKLRDESWLLLALVFIAALGLLITMQANSTRHYLLWIGAISVGLTAVATNAIAMSMLLRDSAFGTVTVASGLVSVAFFGGFALGPPLYGHLVIYSSALSWSVLIAFLLIGCGMAISLAMARHKPATEVSELKAEVALLKSRIDELESNYALVLHQVSDYSQILSQLSELANRQELKPANNVVALAVLQKNKSGRRKKP
jgi:MFS family permease